MYHATEGYLAATNEVLSLYVDLNQRKVVEFETDRVKIMDEYIKKNFSTFDKKNLYFLNKLKK